MAVTPSTMVALGTRAARFALPDVVSGRKVRFEDFAGSRGLLVMFISRHCPYVQHVKKELTRLGNAFLARGLAVVAVSSNDARAYPEDSPDRLKEMAVEEGWRFPVCYDESQKVARDYGAACTPDFFLFDQGFRLAYRGQLDASRPGNGVPVTGGDLRAAIEALLAGRPIAAEQRPSAGCNIKWAPSTPGP